MKCNQPKPESHIGGKHAVSLALSMLWCFSGTAEAQNVTIYGIVDTGIEYVTNVGPSQLAVTRMPSLTGSLPSRWGIRGSEDLGDGLKTIFALESGFALDQGTSNQGGRLFGRQAFVGVAGPWGTVSLGRQYTQTYQALIGADTMGPNIYAGLLLDSYIPNARVDNSIAYRGMFSGLTIGGTYSMGRDAVGVVPAGGCAGESSTDSMACRNVSAMLRYDAATWGTAASYERMYGGAGIGSPLPASSQTDTRSMINGYVKAAGATIGGGLIRRTNDGSVTPNSDLFFVGASYPMGSLLFDVQYGQLDAKNSSDDASVLAVRAMYNFSKRTATYITMGHMNNKGNAAFSIDGGVITGSAPAAGVDQTGVMVGMRHSF